MAAKPYVRPDIAAVIATPEGRGDLHRRIRPTRLHRLRISGARHLLFPSVALHLTLSTPSAVII